MTKPSLSLSQSQSQVWVCSHASRLPHPQKPTPAFLRLSPRDAVPISMNSVLLIVSSVREVHSGIRHR